MELPTPQEAAEYKEKDKTASHIAYHLVVSTVNRKLNDDERESIQQVIKQAAVQLNTLLMLSIQNKYKLSFEIYGANSGKRNEPIYELEQ
jgi:hypothetical protein